MSRVGDIHPCGISRTHSRLLLAANNEGRKGAGGRHQRHHGSSGASDEGRIEDLGPRVGNGVIDKDTAAKLIPLGLLGHVVVNFLAQLCQSLGGLNRGIRELVVAIKCLLEDAFVDTAKAKDVGCAGGDGRSAD